jgi:hypothetical protein
MSDAPEIRDQSMLATASRRRAPGATVGMELLPKSILKDVPALYATERVALAAKVVRAKLFVPWTAWTFTCFVYTAVDAVEVNLPLDGGDTGTFLGGFAFGRSFGHRVLVNPVRYSTTSRQSGRRMR